jgi:hypothetical protein
MKTEIETRKTKAKDFTEVVIERTKKSIADDEKDGTPPKSTVKKKSSNRAVYIVIGAFVLFLIFAATRPKKITQSNVRKVVSSEYSSGESSNSSVEFTEKHTVYEPTDFYADPAYIHYYTVHKGGTVTFTAYDGRIFTLQGLTWLGGKVPNGITDFTLSSNKREVLSVRKVLK